MNVLITGGTGFIGSRLALHLLRQGHAVRIYGQLNTPAEEQNARLLREKGAEIRLGSMTAKVDVGRAVQNVKVVFHLAAAQHEANVPDRVFWEVNLAGTRTLLAAGMQAGVRRFVHGSTIGVYGSGLGGLINEKTPVRPDNIYGTTKLAAERAVMAAKDHVPVVAIRISETYGPGDRRLLKLFKGIDRGTFFIIGGGGNIHHLIFVQDLVDGLLLAAEKQAAVGQVFVLAGKEPLTTLEMVRTVARVLGKPMPRLCAPLGPFLLAAVAMELALKPLGIQPPLHRRRLDFFRKSFLFDNAKAASLLDFQPRVSFAQGAGETAAWYRAQKLL